MAPRIPSGRGGGRRRPRRVRGVDELGVDPGPEHAPQLWGNLIRHRAGRRFFGTAAGSGPRVRAGVVLAKDHLSGSVVPGDRLGDGEHRLSVFQAVQCRFHMVGFQSRHPGDGILLDPVGVCSNCSERRPETPGSGFERSGRGEDKTLGRNALLQRCAPAGWVGHLGSRVTNRPLVT